MLLLPKVIIFIKMTKKLLHVFFCLWFWLLSNSVYGNIAFYHYGTEQGLSESAIIDIEQDSFGFIWLAGNYSLTRFDGENFVEFAHTIQRPLPWNKINEIYIDKNGILWIASDKGFSFYNTNKNEFESTVAGWETVNVNDISENGKEQLLLATDQGLASYDKSTREIVWITGPKTVFTTNEKLKPVLNISHVENDQNNNVWLSMKTGGLLLLNTVDGDIKAFQQMDGFALNDLQINHHAIKNGNLLLATLHHGLLELDVKNKKVRQFQFDVNLIPMHFQIASDSVIWLATDNGLVNLNPHTKKFIRYTNIPIDPYSMTRTAVSHVMIDANNNLWVSNVFRGIDFGLNNIIFNHMMYSEDNSYTVSETEVTSADTDNDGNLWVGYESGLIEKNIPKTTTKQKYYLISPKTGKRPGAIFKVFQDNKGRIWAGGWISGLFQFNKSSNTFEKAIIKPQSMAALLKNADIRDIIEDGSGNLWIVAHGLGIANYNPENGQTKLYQHNENDPQLGISNNNTYDFCFDADSNLWISSAHGITRMNVQNEQFTNFFHSPNDSLSLSSDKTITVYCDAANNIWVGTDNGLNVFIPELNKFQPIPTGRDFDFLIINALESVRRNEIWASTKSGLLKLTYRKNNETSLMDSEIEYYFPSNGLISSVYFERSSTTLGNLIYFGGNGGIDFFNPYEEIQKNKALPEIVITETSVYGERLHSDINNNENPELVLSHDQKMISFRFIATNFINSKKQRFRYMLEDFDEQWVYPQDEKVATYTNLPNGKYIFKVEVSDKNGEWIGNPESHISLRVKPPFWETIPFIAAVILIGLLLFYLIQRLRYKAMIKRQHVLEKQVQERTRELRLRNEELKNANQTKSKFFSIISHDLRSPFSGLLGILELLKDPDYLPKEMQKELTNTAHQSAENTFKLLENLLIWSNSQTGKLNFQPKTFDLSKKLENNIELNLHQAEQKKIKIKGEFKQGLKAFGDPNMIDTVIRNLLNNAIKFTDQKGEIVITTIEDTQKITVSISDTGVGMTQEQIEHLFEVSTNSKPGTNGESGTGLGLVLAKEFVTKNKGEIWATENHPKGTTFHFTIPKSKE